MRCQSFRLCWQYKLCASALKIEYDYCIKDMVHAIVFWTKKRKITENPDARNRMMFVCACCLCWSRILHLHHFFFTVFFFFSFLFWFNFSIFPTTIWFEFMGNVRENLTNMNLYYAKIGGIVNFVRGVLQCCTFLHEFLTEFRLKWC